MTPLYVTAQRRPVEMIVIWATVIVWGPSASGLIRAMDSQAYNLLTSLLPEQAWGALALAASGAAMWSLWLNGFGTWRSALARVCAYILLATFYSVIAAGFAVLDPWTTAARNYGLLLAPLCVLCARTAAEDLAARVRRHG